jgi:sugar lactone lactonase YvrE
MKLVLAAALALVLTACASVAPTNPTVAILVDLDPASVDRSLIVESITADRNGMLFVADRVSGNVLRIDPKAPVPVVVARIEAREVQGRRVNADPGGLAFDAQGDLYIASGPFAEVLRVRAADLNPAKPGLATTWGTGTPGANGIAFDKQGGLFVSGGASGIVFRVAAGGGAAQPAAQVERFVRTLPDGKTQQAIVANGLAFDAQGVLHIADTARGAIWRVTIAADGKGAAPVLLVQNAALEGADGVAFDRSGRLWVASNEINAVVAVTAAGVVQPIARNGSAGPLEFPSAIVFVGPRAYVSNFDVPRRDNLDASGTTARDGVGASIAVITP